MFIRSPWLSGRLLILALLPACIERPKVSGEDDPELMITQHEEVCQECTVCEQCRAPPAGSGWKPAESATCHDCARFLGRCFQPDYYRRVVCGDVRVESGRGYMSPVPGWMIISTIPVLMACAATFGKRHESTADREKMADHRRYIQLVERVAFETNVQMLENVIEARIKHDLTKERPHMTTTSRNAFTDSVMKTVHSSTTFWLAAHWWLNCVVKFNSIHLERWLYSHHSWQAQRLIDRLPHTTASPGEMKAAQQQPQSLASSPSIRRERRWNDQDCALVDDDKGSYRYWKDGERCVAQHESSINRGRTSPCLSENHDADLEMTMSIRHSTSPE